MLSLMALACLPIALSDLVRDAGISLLLPLTLSGMILAWALAGLGARKLSSAVILLFLGPLTLYLRISRLGNPLLAWAGESLSLIPAFFKKLIYQIPFDNSFLIASKNEFIHKALVFNGRILPWIINLFGKARAEDFVVRTLMWSMVLWLVAIWAGWQIYRNKRFMAGMFPSTVLLAFVLNYTGGAKEILWYHLALLLFLYGLTHYQQLLNHWKASHTDYAESTGIDTLILVGILTLGLVSASFITSTFSIKEILDDLREKRAAPHAAQTASTPGQQPAKEVFRVTGLENGLPRSYLLSAGPEISRQLAMTISTGELPPMSFNAHPTIPSHHWRTLTYSIYTGSGWSNPSFLAVDVAADQPLIETPDESQRILKAKVTFANGTDERLYWTGALLKTDVPLKAAWRHKAKDNNPLDNDLFGAFTTVEAYQFESILPDVSAQELRDSSGAYPAWVQKQFTALPDSVPERVLALARDLTASEPTSYDRALAIQNYLREIPYTLDIPTPPAGRDVTDYFLFDLKRGYCDYYATSMVVLARAAGLPARLVVGYANGTYNLESAQYIVTENYAHSWVEVYFTDIGWVEFEPTANQSAIAYADRSTATSSSTENQPEKFSLKEMFPFLFQYELKNILLPAAFIFACILLWIGFDSLRLKRIEPAQTIQLLYKRLRRLARPVTGYASKNKTAHSYSFDLVQRLSALEVSPRLQNWIAPSRKEIKLLTELFSRSLFAPLPPTRAEAQNAIKAWSSLKWRLALANLLIIVMRRNMLRR